MDSSSKPKSLGRRCQLLFCSPLVITVHNKRRRAVAARPRLPATHYDFPFQCARLIFLASPRRARGARLATADVFYRYTSEEVVAPPRSNTLGFTALIIQQSSIFTRRQNGIGVQKFL